MSEQIPTDPTDPRSASGRLQVPRTGEEGWRGWKPIRKIVAAGVAAAGAPPILTLLLEGGEWDSGTWLKLFVGGVLTALTGYLVPSKPDEPKAQG